MTRKSAKGSIQLLRKKFHVRSSVSPRLSRWKASHLYGTRNSALCWPSVLSAGYKEFSVQFRSRKVLDALSYTMISRFNLQDNAAPPAGQKW